MTLTFSRAGEHDGVRAHARKRPRQSSRAAVLAAVLVAVPFVVCIVSLVGRHWYPAGDQALEILRIRDVGTSHTPLLGAWSRWGWAHPGPWLFWALAPFDKLFGTTGVLVGMALINGAAAVGVVLVAQRRAGPRLAVLAGLAVALLTNTMGLSLLLDPWNPWAGFLPFVLFLFLAWAVIDDDVVLLPVAVGVGSFVVQAHVGFLPLVGGLLALAVGWSAVNAVRAQDMRLRFRSRRWLVIAGVVAAVLWLPTLVQQVTGDPHNLSDLVTYARNPTDKAAGWPIAYGTLGLQLKPFGPWLTNSEVTVLGLEKTDAVLPGAITLLLVAGAGWFAYRRGSRTAWRLALVALVSAVLALFATARVTGIVVPYVLRWWWGVAALCWLSIAWSLLATVRSRAVRTAASALAIAGMVATAAIALAEWPAPMPVEPVSTALAAVDAPTTHALDKNQRYLVRGNDSRTWDAASSGLYAQLADEGYHVFSDPGPYAKLEYGPWRLARPEQVDGIVTIVALPEIDDGYQAPAGSRVVATYDPLTPADRVHERDLNVRIRDALGPTAPVRVLLDSPASRSDAVRAGASPADVEALHQLQLRDNGYTVFVSPPA